MSARWSLYESYDSPSPPATTADILDAAMRLVADPRVHPSAHDNAVLMFACRHGDLSAVNVLLADDRVDPAAHGNAPLLWAARRGHIDIVQRLLHCRRVNPSAGGCAALIAAAEFGRLPLLENLLTDHPPPRRRICQPHCRPSRAVTVNVWQCCSDCWPTLTSMLELSQTTCCRASHSAATLRRLLSC